jgi:hypothetical protein
MPLPPWRRPLRSSSPVLLAWTLGGARLTPSRTSLSMASRGVVAVATSPSPCVDTYRCAPPTDAGESVNCCARRGGGRHPSFLHPGVDACQCAPSIVVGESENGSARHGGGRHHLPPPVQAWMLAGACLLPSRASPGMAPRGVAAAKNPLSSSRRERLPVRASHRRE